MKIERQVLHLPEGDKRAEVTIYDKTDIPKLFRIYKLWRKLCDKLGELNARAANLPDGLSEVSFAISHNMWRRTSNIQGANSSFDCYDPNGQQNCNRIQVKACSVLPDLTSFGPNPDWDRIFFVDFYREGKWDGTFDVYELRTADILSFSVNATQTVANQGAQARRPRFSIYDGLIQANKYISKKTFQITQSKILEI